jgi:hypothetical protein
MQEYMDGVLTPLLMGLFGSVKGDLTFETDEGQFNSPRDFEPIEAYLVAQFAAVSIRLATSEDQAASYGQWFRSADDAHAHVEATGREPWIALVHSEKGMVLVFVEAETIEGATAYFDECAQDGTSLDAIPLPGFGGWELTEASRERLATGEVTPAVAEPEVDPAAPVEFNDAILLGGDPAQEILDRPLKLGFGRNRQEKKFPAKPTTIGGLLGLLSKHVETSQKDGSAVLQGWAVKNERKSRAMDTMYLVGFDVDCGYDPDTVIGKLRELNLLSVVYTTYSNMKPLTLIPQSSFAKWAKKQRLDATPTDEAMATYLIEARSWLPEIANSVKVQDDVDHSVEGVCWKVEHLPMPKFRVMLFLESPYVMSGQKGLLHQDAIQRWKNRLCGAARMLQIPIDESCLDPSRLFYLPTHPAGGEFSITIINGRLLNFDLVPEVELRSNSVPDDDVFAAAAREIGSSGSMYLGEFNLKHWAVKVADRYQIADMLRDASPERVRGDANTNKIEVECPFDFEHSNAGDPEDRACYVVNAQDDGRDNGFVWGCQHASCKPRNRLDFVKQAAESGWFTTEELEDAKYLVHVVGDENKPHKDSSTVLREWLTWAATAARGPEFYVQFEALYRADGEHINKGDMSVFTQACVDRKIAKEKQIKDKVGTIKKEMQRAMAQQEAAARNADMLRRIRDLGISVPDGVEVFIMNNGEGHLEQKDRIRDTLNLMNNPWRLRDGHMIKLFDFGTKKVVVDYLAEIAEKRVNDLNINNMSNVLESRLRFYKQQDEEGGYVSIGYPERVLKELVDSNDWKCPVLKSFAMLPYYTEDGELVTKAGYHPKSQIYLMPKLTDLEVPTKPTKAEVDAAKKLLFEDIWGEFPFDDGADGDNNEGLGSRAHFAALLLQPFVRPMIKGSTPLYLCSKPTPGTGATLMLTTALIVNTGEDPKAMTDSNNDEEQRKAITSAFMAGETYFWLDNVKERLQSAAFANLATSSVWSDRMLGRSELKSFENTLQFIASGNNPRGTAEIMRRALPIRLDAKIDPLKRTGFKIKNLKEHVLQNRKQLTEAALTLVNAWIADGKKVWTGKPLPSFESYSEIMGGILQSIGIKGFLSNLHLATIVANEETAAWESFFNTWLTKVGMDKPVRIRDISAWFEEQGDAELPNIGVPYRNEPRSMEPYFNRKIKEKVGAIVEMLWDDRKQDVAIKAHKDERTAQITYSLTTNHDIDVKGKTQAAA